MDQGSSEKSTVEVDEGTVVDETEGLVHTRAYATGISAAMQGAPPIMAAEHADKIEDMLERLAFRLGYVSIAGGELPPMRGTM